MIHSSFLLPFALAGLCACGPAQTAETPGTSAPAETKAPVADVPVTPEKTAPPDVSDDEKKELAGTCAPLTTAMIESDSAAIHALDDALRDDLKGEGADDKALAVGLEKLKKAREGLSPGDEGRCLRLFEKQERRKLFDHEPAEEEARAVVDTCIKRVDAVYGKQTMAFDMGGERAPQQGPFCPDDFPVPPKLSQLPYKSNKTDWDTPAFRCLQFGLRVEQRVQFEYNAPINSDEFTCIARYLPRKGGAPVEIFRGGKRDAEGHLLLAPKQMRRRMKI